MVPFCRAVLEYWITLDPSGLEPFVSANTMELVRAELGWARGPHEVLAGLRDLGAPARETDGGFLDGLLAMTPDALEAELARLEHTASDRQDGHAAPWETDRRRVALLVRTYQLVALKYSLSAGDVGAAVGHDLQIKSRTRQRFARAVEAWRRRPAPAARDRLLDAALALLEELKAIVLAPAASVATENIYQKRHIAAGIPSIYGNYSEPKFDALGLSFRVETLVGRLLEDLVAEGIEPYVTRASLRRMAKAIEQLTDAFSLAKVPTVADIFTEVARPTPSCVSSARSPLTASTRAPSRPTSRCSRPASASTTSPSTSTRTCSSSWSTA